MVERNGGSVGSPPVNAVPVVVFVDDTNLVRSPAAAGMFAAHAATSGIPVVARSAGTQAVHGAPADARLRRRVGPAFGCLTVHRSVPFAGEVATSADLVLCMEPEHEAAAVRAYPWLAHRTFTWKAMLALSARVAPRAGGVDLWVAALHHRRITCPPGGPRHHEVVHAPRGSARSHRRFLCEVDALAARTAALLAASSLTPGERAPEAGPVYDLVATSA